MFGRKRKKDLKPWTYPGGDSPWIYYDCTLQTHLLIAGSTGSGKSVFVSGIINSILHWAPCEKQILFIDPKQVDYIEFENIPHSLGRLEYPDQIAAGLEVMCDLMQLRLDMCKKAGIKISTEPEIFIIVDEYPDIVQTNPAAVRYIERISRLGRAARIHLIICTQRCTRDVLNGVISANMTAKIALHTTTKQESRNIISLPYAADLPLYGKCLYQKPGDPLYWYHVPMIPPAENQKLIDFWIEQKNSR